MQRLSLNPSPITESMSAGGEIHEAGALTAPGSQGVAPAPVGLTETLPLPVASGPQIPVNPQRDRVAGNAAPGGDGPWAEPGFIHEGDRDSSGWRET